MAADEPDDTGATPTQGGDAGQVHRRGEMGKDSTTVDSPDRQAESRRGFTALVYFHGIGTPRRHEEISRLADALDQFAQTQEQGSVGRLRRFAVHWEPSVEPGFDDFAYVEMARFVERFAKKKKDAKKRIQ